MEKLSNVAQKVLWATRSQLGIPQKTIAPVLWRPSAITSKHFPSDKFRRKFPENSEKIDKILIELEIISKLSKRFPRRLSDSDWKTLLEVKTRKNRYDQLLFLYRKEILNQQDGKKKNERKRERVRKSDKFLVLPHVTHFTEEWMKMRNLIEKFRFHPQTSPVLAVDCQFLPFLTPRGRGLTALQLQYLTSENRRKENAFRMFFVNYPRKEPIVRELEKTKLLFLKNRDCVSPIVSENGLKETFGENSKIIYLSPDAEEELEEVEDDTVYVIGGIVDRVPEHGISKKASLEAAEKAGVPARKLPIDRFIDFKSGSRFLTLLAVAEILREVNLDGNWKKAMEKSIPNRNTKSSNEKNPIGKEAYKRIREFNAEVLRRVDEQLGKEKF